MTNLYDIKIDFNGKPYLEVVKELKTYGPPEYNIELCGFILGYQLEMWKLASEIGVVVGLDHNNRYTGFYIVGKGSDVEVSHSLKMLSTFLILSGSKKFIHAHNHPNSSHEQSEQDKIATQTFKSFFSQLEIPLIDECIIGGKNKSFKFYECGFEEDYMYDDFESFDEQYEE